MEKDEVFNKEFSEILEKEEKLLDSLAQKQLVLRKAVVEKDWESLQTLISEVNQISDSFQQIDQKRENLMEQKNTEEIKPYFDKLSILRTKLLKCKVENQVISNYVNVTREFISEVIDKALPKTHNNNYTRNGTIVQHKAASVLVDVRG